MRFLNKTFKGRNLAAKTAFVAGTMFVGSQAFAISAIQTAVLAKIGEAETFGYALLAVSLVATIGIKLVKKFANKGS